MRTQSILRKIYYMFIIIIHLDENFWSVEEQFPVNSEIKAWQHFLRKNFALISKLFISSYL